MNLQLTGLSKILANELSPPLRNVTVLPLQLSQERDEAIFHLTEGRIPVFAHDLVPDYLRTKPEPTAEQRMLTHEQKVSDSIQFSQREDNYEFCNRFFAGKQYGT